MDGKGPEAELTTGEEQKQAAGHAPAAGSRPVGREWVPHGRAEKQGGMSTPYLDGIRPPVAGPTVVSSARGAIRDGAQGVLQWRAWGMLDTVGGQILAA